MSGRAVRAIFRVLVFVVCFNNCSALASESTEIETQTGALISVTQYSGEGEHLLLWLPSERGMRGAYQPVAMDLAALGLDVWALDLHTSFMVPESRSSIDEFDRNDILSLLEYTRSEGFKRISFITTGRGAVLALELAELWQNTHPHERYIHSHLLMMPHLLANSPQPGENALYKTVSRRSNLPIYLIQPEYSTKYARTTEIAEVLATGGSPVFTHLLKGVAGGFHARPEEDLNERDLEAKQALPDQIISALKLMNTSRYRSPVKVPEQERSIKQTSEQPDEQNLQIYRGKMLSAELELPSLYGGRLNLQDYTGNLVLLNFWASWCGPCVAEIPSLSRLAESFADQRFKVITVNIGEDESHVREFVKDLPVNFEILLDRDSKSVREWRVYAYPTNFLLDRQGRITHAYRGALEWDRPEIVQLIESML